MTRKSDTLKQENVEDQQQQQQKKKAHYVEPIQVVLMTMMIFL